MNKQQYHTKAATKQNVGQTEGTTNAICLSNIPTAIDTTELRKIPLSNIHLSKNFVVGNTQQNDDLKNRVWVATEMPAGNLDEYVVGDIVLNINPDLTLLENGEPKYPDLWFASWICVNIPVDPYKIFKGMEKIFMVILALMLFSWKTAAQETWFKTYNLNSFSAYDLHQNEEGYIILASVGTQGAMLFQTDVSGDSAYYNNYQLVGNNTGQYLGGFAKTYDNGYVIVGTTLPGYRISILKTNADKSIGWNNVLFCDNDTLRGYCVDAINLSDSNVLVAGHSECNTGMAYDLFLTKIDINTGNVIWQRIYNTATYISGGNTAYHSLDAVKVLALPDGYLLGLLRNKGGYA